MRKMQGMLTYKDFVLYEPAKKSCILHEPEERRKQKEKIKMKEEIKKIIEENPVALASLTNYGKPYVIAVAFVKVKDEKIIITANYMKTTLENIKRSKNISLAVWDKEGKGYQINGEAEYFEKGKWFDFVKSIPENKNEPCKGAVVVDIKEIKKLA